VLLHARLCNKAAAVNQPDGFGNTLLHAAVMAGQTDLAAYLVRLGAGVSHSHSFIFFFVCVYTCVRPAKPDLVGALDPYKVNEAGESSIELACKVLADPHDMLTVLAARPRTKDTELLRRLRDLAAQLPLGVSTDVMDSEWTEIDPRAVPSHAVAVAEEPVLSERVDMRHLINIFKNGGEHFAQGLLHPPAKAPATQRRGSAEVRFMRYGLRGPPYD
jgi:hypothetical protein